MEKAKATEIYQSIKKDGWFKPFDEIKHCVLMLECLGRMTTFCARECVSDNTVYKWLKKSELFQEVYALSKMFGKEAWEEEGEEIRDEPMIPGTTNNRFEHWKMIGWSRYGVGKNPKVRLDLETGDSPDKHYQQLIAQARGGEFTASEFKQLMEAINVGLSVRQQIAMQNEIDELKADLATMSKNTDGHNTIPNTRAKKED